MSLLWCQMCTFYFSLRKKRCTLLPESRDVHIQQHIYQKDLNLCLPLYKVIVELGKTQTRNSTVFMLLIIWSNSTLKFLFLFGFNECLWAIFSLLSFENFWFYICVVVVPMTFNFMTQMTLRHLLHPYPWIKISSAKTTKSILKCWERSVKRMSNLKFIRVI